MLVLLPEARRLFELGYSVVPGDIDKRPKVAWKVWQDRPQTEQEFNALGHGSVAGIVTGQAHGLVVLDFDGAEGVALAKSLGLQPNVITGSGGWHVWLDSNVIGYFVKTCAAVKPGLDVRGEGGLVWTAGRSRKGEYHILSTDKQWMEGNRDAVLAFYREHCPERTALSGTADLGTWDGEEDGRPGALRVLRVQANVVRTAQPGTRNATLNRAAFTVGGLVASGELGYEAARQVLLAAATESNVDGLWAVGDMLRTIEAAFASGYGSPWSAEPQVDADGEVWVTTSDLKAWL